jgi:hypothetical protein
LAAERVERLAETVPTRGGITLRPQQFDQNFTRMGALGMVGEVSQQRSRLLGLEAGHQAIALRRPQPPQQLDPPQLIHQEIVFHGTPGFL